MIDLKNWAGNRQFHAARFYAPRSLDELREIVKGSNKLKAIGTRHCFNGIADTAGDIVSLEHFTQFGELDPAKMTVTFGAGVKYGDLARVLDARGFALHNLASLPHISVAGACATATHGSGDRNGNLATAVRGMEMVIADGSVREVSREADGERFNGMVVHLGQLGVITKLTLAIDPTCNLTQTVYENLPMTQVEAHFDAIMSGGYSVSFFLNWATDAINQVWVKRRASDPPGIDLRQLGAAPTTTNLHPLPGCDPINCTEQVGIPGPWHERLPHFRMEFKPSAGEELQSEYFVAREHALPALREMFSLRQYITPNLLMSEIRTIAADELWLSPSYKRPTIAIHFTWKKDWPSVRKVLPMIEAKLARFNARPHWGKLFAMDAQRIRSLYPKAADFEKLALEFDPQHHFGHSLFDLAAC